MEKDLEMENSLESLKRLKTRRLWIKSLTTRRLKSKKQKAQMDKKEEKSEENKSIPGKILFPDKPSQIVLLLPFPQRFRKDKLDG